MFGQELTNLNYLLQPHSKLNPNISLLETTKHKDLFHYEGLSSSFLGFSGAIEDRENHLQIKKNGLISQTVHSKPDISLLEKHEKKPIVEKLDPWDESVRNDPQYTVYYVTNIFNELKLQESENLLNPLYILNQKEINGKMRAILIDWLIDVHLKFKLSAETLFLAVSILDRYLTKHQISREKFQLLGISCLFLASKYEDIYPPDLKECLFVTENSYSREEFIRLEGEILTTIDFKVKVPTSLVFLERYYRVLNNNDRRMYCLARYLLELSLIDYKFLKFPASNIAISALYLSGKVLKKTFWSEALAKECKMKEEDVRVCAKELCFSLQNANNSILQGVKRKFSTVEYECISKIQLDRLFNK